MSTYVPRHAMVETEESPERRFLVRGGLAAAAATAVGGAGLLVPASAGAATSAKPTLKRGSRGASVKSLQTTLRARGYWHSGSDGVFGQTTEQAVMAVQKVHGLGRDGVCGPQTWGAVNGLSRPRARTTSGNIMELDLSKQVLIFVVSGKVKWVFNTSTGKSGWRTPKGRFSFFRQVNGSDSGPYGSLWRPKYFNGGIAIHGSPSIPGYPASHGCARLSNAACNYIWANSLAPMGRKVWVY